MITLLDVNVLIALLEPQHVHHDTPHHWFAQHSSAGWTTFPLTQNGVLRMLGHPRYPNSPGSPAAAMPLLMGLLSHPDHQFWADELSWSAKTSISCDQLFAHGQITDVCLLVLAVRHQGMLLSFDARNNAKVVQGGKRALHLIRPLP